MMGEQVQDLARRRRYGVPHAEHAGLMAPLGPLESYGRNQTNSKEQRQERQHLFQTTDE